MSVLERMENLIAQTPGGRQTFFDVEEFPWVANVEAYWQAMQKELERVTTAMALLPGFEEIQTEQLQLSNDKRWKIFPLYVYGQWANEHRCPLTIKALRCIPDLQVAMFSILQPKKELPPHRGPYAGVLRYHLGLKVPQPKECGIRVLNDVRHWEEGKSMIFDDSHEHAAWNRSNNDRMVLFVDFSRPLPEPLFAQNQLVIEHIGKSDFIVHALSRWTAWEAEHGKAIDELIGIHPL